MPKHTGWGIALACLVLASRTAFAQPRLTDLLPPPDSLELLMPELVDGGWTGSTAVASVVVDARLQSLIEDLLSRSPAFRRQWRRLEREPRLSLRIELVHANHVGGGAHAATTISLLRDGSLHAAMAIPGGLRLAELVAHEVEHILERLDGVKVDSQHALGDGSVRRASGTFETARAVFVGQLVAKELEAR